MLRLARVVGAAAAIVVAVAPAHADETDSTAKADLAKLLRAGAAAAGSKRWPDCIEAYRAAIAIDDAPATAGELGLCEEQAGRFADAYRHLRRARDAAPPEPAAAKAVQWKRYEDAMVRARKHLVILFVSVSPTGATVSVDGHPVGPADGRHIGIEPGTHTVSAQLNGYEDAIEPPRTWAAGDVPHVHLEMKPKPAPAVPVVVTSKAAAPPAPVASIATAPMEHASSPWYLPAPTPHGALVSLAYVSLVTAVAAGSTAIGLEVDRHALREQVSADACRPSAASRPEVCDALAERAGQRNTALEVAAGAAVAAGLFAGAARVAFGFERASSTPTVAPAASATGGGIVVTGAW